MSRQPQRSLPILFSLVVLAAGAGAGFAQDEARLSPGLLPVAPGARVLEAPSPLDVDWRLGLRGTVTLDGEGNGHLGFLIVPGVSALLDTGRTHLTFEAEAEIVPQGSAAPHLGAVSAGLDLSYRADAVTLLTFGAGIDLVRPDPLGPDVPAGVLEQAATASGSIMLGASRDFGAVSAGWTGAAERGVSGPTTLADLTVIGNEDANRWTLETGLRLGYALTPVVELYGRGTVGRTVMDAPSASLAERLDASDVAFSAGVIGRWGGLEAEFSAGAGLRRFDAATIEDIRTVLFDARVSFSPDPTLTFSASAGRGFAPAGGAGVARIVTTAEAEADYLVNAWLALHGGVNWRDERVPGAPGGERAYGVDLGADYLLSEAARLSADYGLTRTEPEGGAGSLAHRLTLGVTLSR